MLHGKSYKLVKRVCETPLGKFLFGSSLLVLFQTPTSSVISRNQSIAWVIPTSNWYRAQGDVLPLWTWKLLKCHKGSSSHLCSKKMISWWNIFLSATINEIHFGTYLPVRGPPPPCRVSHITTAPFTQLSTRYFLFLTSLYLKCRSEIFRSKWEQWCVSHELKE